MTELIMLGTGCAMVTECYNTCFALKNDDDVFLVDAGGGNGILVQMEKIGADYTHIHKMFVTHGHTDHVLGVIWVIRQVATLMSKGKYDGEFDIYCHDVVADMLRYFVKTMLKLAKTHDSLTVVSDQVGSPTSTVDLARAIIALMKTDKYGLYHGTCEGQCSWYDFAKKIFELSQVDIAVSPVSSEEYVSKTPRPKYSVLENAGLKSLCINVFRPWEESLVDYLEWLAAQEA